MNMEIIYSSLAILASIFFLHKILSLSKSNKKNKSLPPSPPSIPILGHLHLLKQPFQHSFQALSQRYGSILSLQLGRQPALLVSSPWAVEECFSQNDVVFAERPKYLIGKYLGCNYTVLFWAPYGSHWRDLRRVATITTLSQKQIQLAGPARRVELRNMITELSENGTRTVNLNELFSKLARNLVMRVVHGKPWETKDMSPSSHLMTVCDFIPVLRWVGYKGIETEMIRVKKERDEIVRRLVAESKESRAFRRTCGVHGDGENKTMIEELLDLQEKEPDFYTDDIVKGLILVLLLAGTDTVAETLEWAMTLLLNHPEVLDKAKAEIDTHIEKGRLVEDSDLPKLTYISCIISETLRLFPPVPLLIPHYSSGDCTIGGYHIAKGTLLVVNAWAIHRDPALWENATEFKPERFENDKLKRFSFKYFPFGMGRRACPGSNFALRNVNLVLATLIQCFDWEATKPKPIDLNEKVDQVICRLRPSMEPFFSQI